MKLSNSKNSKLNKKLSTVRSHNLCTFFVSLVVTTSLDLTAMVLECSFLIYV